MEIKTHVTLNKLVGAIKYKIILWTPACQEAVEKLQGRKFVLYFDSPCLQLCVNSRCIRLLWNKMV